MNRASELKGTRRILFVCLGNICRSPLAEGIFADLVKVRGLRSEFVIDSCGTGGWHAGELADPRALAAARKRGIDLGHRARQLDPARDFAEFELLVPMDHSNAKRLTQLGASRERVRLMRSFDGAADGAEVPDPYYGVDKDFDTVAHMLHAACRGLLDEVM